MSLFPADLFTFTKKILKGKLKLQGWVFLKGIEAFLCPNSYKVQKMASLLLI